MKSYVDSIPQICELTQNVASMESQVRQQGEQRHKTESDLTAVRDLCVKLDQQKDTLMQQLDDKDTCKTQVNNLAVKCANYLCRTMNGGNSCLIVFSTTCKSPN